MLPEEIEKRSFAIIDAEAGDHGYDQRTWQVVRRVIHTTADFEWLEMIRFHPGAIDAGISAICSGARIITDTNMAGMGIRRQAVEKFGCRVSCQMANPEVATAAAEMQTTRARAAVDLEAGRGDGGIWVVGNAPTALLRLIELVSAEKLLPDLVIGLPVGFVNAAESKAKLMELDLPWISNLGRKGGSNVAAAVVNALALLAIATEPEPKTTREQL